MHGLDLNKEVNFALPINKEMKKSKLILAAFAFAGSTLIISCGGEVEDTGPKYNFEKADSLPDDYLKELGIVKTNIELTAKLFETMNENGFSFNEGNMLSAGKSFSGSSKQAMGVGAIGTDMVYAISFKQNQSAIARMEGLLSQSNALGVAEAFDKSLMEKLSSEDSTINKSVILTKAYLNAKDQLFSEERAQLATFMVIGGWLEGLHISSNMCKDDLSNLDIRLGLWEICNTYSNVMSMSKVFESNADMKDISTKISELGPLVKRISGNSKKYNSEDVVALAEGVAKIRNSVL